MKLSRNCPKEHLKIAEGTVLAVPLGSSQWALGQVISPGINFYIGFPLTIFDEPIFASDLAKAHLKLFSWTNDAEIFRGNWRNLGEVEIVSTVRLPEYRVNLEGRPHVESFDGLNYREFDETLDGNLKYRKIRSPLLVQRGVRGALGLEDPNITSEEMLA